MKKFKTLLIMLACVLAFTACNGEKKLIQYDENDIKQQCASMYELISTENIKSELENSPELLNLNDDGMEILSIAVKSNLGVRTEGNVVISAIDSFEDALDLLGDRSSVAPTGKFEFDAKEDELIVTMFLTGSEHEGSIEYMFDKNLHLTSMTTNAKYSLGESMEKAGINTAIGMGTVFVMLIAIMFIIKLLGIIPKLQANSEKKKANKANKANTEESVNNTISAIAMREEAECDDLELIAVISAAIAASEGTSTDGFVVRSIKRIR